MACQGLVFCVCECVSAFFHAPSLLDPIPVCRYTNTLPAPPSTPLSWHFRATRERRPHISLWRGMRCRCLYLHPSTYHAFRVCVCVFRCAPCLLRVTFGDPPLKVDSINVGRILWLCVSARSSSVYPPMEEGCRLLSAGTPSYIHVKRQHVTEDKVLQSGFSLTQISSSCSVCVCVCVSHGG